jgi:hypothetical protein
VSCADELRELVQVQKGMEDREQPSTERGDWKRKHKRYYILPARCILHTQHRLPFCTLQPTHLIRQSAPHGVEALLAVILVALINVESDSG